jgi:flagellar basal-body rod protein FlgB
VSGMYVDLFRNYSGLEKAIDASVLKYNVISNNIANVDTPEFKKSTVKFDSILSDVIDKNKNAGSTELDSKISSIEPEVVKSNATSMRTDGNNVDIDTEMADLSKNTIEYNALIQEMSSSLKRLSIAINGGR